MLVSPSAPIQLPADIAKARTDALNVITTAEAEYRRIVELQIAKELDIVELVKRKAYEEELISKLTPQVKLLQNEVSELEKKVSYLKEGITAEQVAITSKVKELTERESKCKEIESNLEERNSILTRDEKQYSVKYDYFMEDVAVHKQKVEILTKALNLC